MKKILTTLIVMLTISGVALAQADPQKFINLRSYGMGGTGAAVGQGLDVLYMNPALMQYADPTFHILSFRMAADEDSLSDKDKFMDLVEEVNDINDDGTLSDSEKTSLIIDKLTDAIPMKLRLMGSVGLPFQLIGPSPLFFTGFSNNWGFGVFNNGNLQARIVEPADPKIKVSGQADTAVMLGFSNHIVEGWIPTDFELGVSLKYVGQFTPYNSGDGETTYEIGAGDLAGGGDIEIGYQGGTGIGVDVGLAKEVDFGLKNERVGVVMRDFMTSISGETVTDVSADIKEDYDDSIPFTATVGYTGTVEFDLPFLRNFVREVVVAADYDLFSTDVSMFKRIHLGAEAGFFGDMLKVRFGNHQGNMCFGLGFSAMAFHFDYANYTDELGRKVGIEPVTYQVLEAGIYF